MTENNPKHPRPNKPLTLAERKALDAQKAPNETLNTQLQELIDATVINTTTLQLMRTQVATQTATLDEVKRYNAAVHKAVNWDSLAEEVWNGVAAGIDARFRNTTEVLESLDKAVNVHNARIEEFNKTTRDTAKAFSASTKETENQTREVSRAVSALKEAENSLIETRSGLQKGVGWATAVVVAICLVFGFWAGQQKRAIQIAEEIGAVLAKDPAHSLCARMGAVSGTTDTGVRYCAHFDKK